MIGFRFLRWILVTAAALGAMATSSFAAGSGAGGAVAKPRLVVVIVVDQFRADYLDRFHDLFGKKGFRRLTDGGADFTDANYDYVPTYTAPGHAAVFTGADPAQNGIVGNSWFDRSTGETHAMVFDPTVHLVTADGVSGQGGAPGPRLLIGTTIGDQMRLANHFRSRVIAISQKDRAAVLPGGRHPNGAYWFDAKRGEFVTSDYYATALPDWVKRFNREHGPARYFGRHWERLRPARDYARAQTRAEEPAAPGRYPALGGVVTGGLRQPGPDFYAAFYMSPFATEQLAELAETAVVAESLGVDDDPDLLAVSFSTPDLVGHTYGPDSQEVEDTYLRLDATIAGLLDFINAHVGLSRTIIAVTGDHGVCPVPEYLQAHGIDAGRVSPKAVEAAVRDALAAHFGKGDWLFAMENSQLFLNDDLIRERKLDPEDMQRVAGDAAMTVEGMAAYFTRAQIENGDLPAGTVAERVANGFDPARCGDVCLVPRPFYFLSEGGAATTHGSPYDYDTHVPVVLFGPGVRPGRYDTACSPCDIAPTLAALLGVEPPPERTGRVLAEAIASSRR